MIDGRMYVMILRYLRTSQSGLQVALVPEVSLTRRQPLCSARGEEAGLRIDKQGLSVVKYQGKQ